VRSVLRMHPSFALLASFIGLASGAAWAQDSYPLVPPTPAAGAKGPLEPNLNCTALVDPDPTGPDQLRVKCKGLIAGSSYTLYLAQSSTPGATPVSFIGHFQADADGKGKLAAVVEVTDAFIGINNKLDVGPMSNMSPGVPFDAVARDGIVDVPGAGASVAGGMTIALDFLRLYRALPNDGVPTVFGIAADQPGGLFVATTQQIRSKPRARIAPPVPVAPSGSGTGGSSGSGASSSSSSGITIGGGSGGAAVAGPGGVVVIGGVAINSTTSR
jgi:hypothetical protein